MADPIASFQGLGTGIQFRDLVDSIIAAESRPITLVQRQISLAQARNTAWDEFRARVLALNTQAAGLADLSKLRSFNTTVANSGVATVTASTSARPGSFSLGVQQLATNEKVGSDIFASRSEALGFSGEFVVNGRAVSVSADQSLGDIAATVNAANTGTNPSRVSATVVGTPEEGYRLVLTSQDSGSMGLQLFEGATGLLQTLGFLDTSVALRSRTSDGAMSQDFSSSSATVSGALGLTTPQAGTVEIGGLSVAVDLAQDSLDDIAASINAAASGAGSPITAQVVTDQGINGNTVYRLDISGTTGFTDSDGILETLGVLERGRSGVAQELQAAAFTANNPNNAASGNTRLTQLWADGVDADVRAGDTIELQGTRGDGSAFNLTFEVQGNSTYQDLVDALNSATDGLQAGSRTATASISDDGRIVVTDDTGGASQLSLSIYTNNEGGGSLDFGDLSLTAVGRERELVAGQDALFEVDGQAFTRSRNTVTNVVDGVTINLTGVSEGPTDVQITRDLDVAADAMDEFVTAMNSILEFVGSETYDVDGQERDNPLFGDGVLRGLRSQLKNAFETTLSDAFGDLNRLGDVGVTIQREGTYEFDRAAFVGALEADATAVERLFQVSGSGSISSLRYVFSTEDTPVGDYQVNVTQAPSRAQVLGTGFGGSYSDDGTPDTLILTDNATGSAYQVLLSNGDTAEEIAEALNAEFNSTSARQLQASTALYADASGTAAGSGTLLQSLFNGGGGSLGVANGDVISISGTDDSGNPVLAEFNVTDVSTQTLGDLAEAVSDALGSDVEVTVEGGLLTATSTSAGGRSFTLSVTSDNAGGGSFSVGALGVVSEGRSAADLSATVEDGQLAIRSRGWGADVSFDLSYAAGGNDGTASLGLAAGTYTGTDIQGTIGGGAATGTGNVLTADEGTAADGLVISYTGADTGVVGEMSFTRGIAALVEQVSDLFVKAGGTLAGVQDRIDTQIDRYNDRIDSIQDRLDQRRAALIEQFTRLEESIAEIQARGNFLLSQLGSLPQGGGGQLG